MALKSQSRGSVTDPPTLTSQNGRTIKVAFNLAKGVAHWWPTRRAEVLKTIRCWRSQRTVTIITKCASPEIAPSKQLHLLNSLEA